MKYRALTGALATLTAASWVVAIGLLVGSIEHRIDNIVTVFVCFVAVGALVVTGFSWLAGQQRSGGARRSTMYRASVSRSLVIASVPLPRPSVDGGIDAPTVPNPTGQVVGDGVGPAPVRSLESPGADILPLLTQVAENSFAVGRRIGRREASM